MIQTQSATLSTVLHQAMAASAILTIAMAQTTATAQTIPVTPAGPIFPTASVDPVARAMAAKALAAAEALSITKTTIVGTDIARTPAVANAGGVGSFF